MLPPGVLHMSAVGCFGRFTFSHLAFHIPTLAGSCLCLFCVVVCLVALFLCFWFLFCKCLGIPNSPRSLDLDDRQGLIARSAMQQKKMVLRFKSSFQQFSDPAGSGTHPRRRLIAPSTWCSMKGFRSGSSLPTPSNQSPWTPAELVGVVTILLDIGLGGVLSLFLQLGSCCVLNSP